MVQDVAARLEAARAGARIAALLLDASLLAGAFAVEHALGTAAGRGADEIFEALTGRTAGDHLAARVRAAR